MLSRLKSYLSQNPTPSPSTLLLLDSGKDYALYRYDARNNMTSAVTDGVTTTNTYNGDGLRVSKTTDGETLYYAYEYDNIILELDESGNQVAQNVWGTRQISRKTSAGTVYFMVNGHGDVTALVDSSSNVIAAYYYDPWGKQREESGEFDNPYR